MGEYLHAWIKKPICPMLIFMHAIHMRLQWQSQSIYAHAVVHLAYTLCTQDHSARCGDNSACCDHRGPQCAVCAPDTHYLSMPVQVSQAIGAYYAHQV